MALWNTVAENEGAKVVESEGEFRVYEKTIDGSNRVGVYESEDVARDVFNDIGTN